MIEPIPSDQIVEHWPEVRESLKAAYEPAGYTGEYVATQLLMRNMQLWRGEKCACVTQINLYPRWKVATVLFLSGKDPLEWGDELMDTIEEWSKNMGCKYVEAHGRIGWSRLGAKRGYRRIWTTVRKEVDGQ